METSPEIKKKAPRPKRKAVKKPPVIPPIENDGTTSKKALLIGEEGRLELLGKGQQWFEVMVNERTDEGRTSIFTSDGVSQTFNVKFNVPQVIPQGAINVLKEAVYLKYFQNLKANSPQMQNLVTKQVPRFSVEILRPLSDEEARKMLREQKRLN